MTQVTVRELANTAAAARRHTPLQDGKNESGVLTLRVAARTPAATNETTRARRWLGCLLSRSGDRGVAVHAAALLAQRAGDRRGRDRLDRDRRHARGARGADLAWEMHEIL